MSDSTDLKIAAAYIRVSTDDQEEYSPDSQIKLCRDWAKKNGYILPDEYVFQDDGISGSSARRRASFNRMIALAKEKDRPFDAILVWKFSRFARNREESVLYKGLLRKHGISVISISEPIVDGPFGSLIESIIEWFDEYYLINLSAEVKRGMEEKLTRGEAMATASFGYRIDSANKTYVIDEQKAAIVRDVFASYAAGEGSRAIAVRLGQSGVRTYRGNPPDNRWVQYVLRNPVYIGKVRWSKDGRAASRRKYDDPNIVIVDGKHQPIISQALWDQVQTRLDQQKQMYGKWQRREQPVEWMLKGLMRCSSCGSTLTYSARNTPSMQCHSYASSRGCYVSHYLSIPRANAAVIDALRKSAALQEFRVVPRNPSAEKPRVDYTRLIDAEKRKLDRCRDAYQAGADTLEEYAENKRRIQHTIRQLESQAAAQPAPDSFDRAAFSKKVLDVVSTITRDDVSEAAKNEALRTIVSHIVFNKPSDTIDVYFYT